MDQLLNNNYIQYACWNIWNGSMFNPRLKYYRAYYCKINIVRKQSASEVNCRLADITKLPWMTLKNTRVAARDYQILLKIWLSLVH